jgi:hypothetical protein
MKQFKFKSTRIAMAIAAQVIHEAMISAKAFAARAAFNLGESAHRALFGYMAGAGLVKFAAFSKEEVVNFEQALQAFEDQLVISEKFNVFRVSDVEAERTNNTIWRPQPYIVQSFNGLDQTANFTSTMAQLSVPISLGFQPSVPLILSATELRDALQETRLGLGAAQRIASDINIACSNLAALTGTIFIKRSAAATGFDDVAAIDTALNRLGVDPMNRHAFYSSSDYNNMASNLAGRVLDNSKSLSAYERASVGMVSSINTHKLDYAYRLTVAAGVTVTVNGANQRYVPRATSTAATGETSNVDNRYQNLTIAVSSGTVKVGDAFTIANVNEVHHITKQDTGSPKTFRITAIISGGGGSGVVQISPPIISADSTPTMPEQQYKNCTATPTNGAPITFLNTATGFCNPFWVGEAMQIMPGRYRPAPDSGLAIMAGTTKQGITMTMARQGNINDLGTKYRWDAYYGISNTQPQMSGVEMFSQP